MFITFSFYIGNKTITVNDQTFDLGKLSTEFLNISAEDFQKMFEQLKDAKHYLDLLKNPENLYAWHHLNEKYIKLDKMMGKFPCLELLRDDNKVLEETQKLTLIPLDDTKFEPTDADALLALQYKHYEAQQENPYEFFIPETFTIKNIFTENEIVEYSNEWGMPLELPEKTPALLITLGNIEEKWEYYKKYVARYEQILSDMNSFHFTITNFIVDHISKMKKLNSSNYAKELFLFFNSPIAYKRVANPIRRTGFYTNTDFLDVSYHTLETEPGSGVFKIYEFFTTELLQFLLKADFYNALNMGYVIRRCAFCRRFFLLKKGYRTKYCDNPMPNYPKYTCSQMGYWKSDIKELAADDPKTQSLIRCHMRIDKDYTRDIITLDEKEALYVKSKNLYNAAQKNPNMSFEKFDEQLQSCNLYPKCNVVRKTRKRGRPKKNAEEVCQ